jgi:hypothetical protein
LSSTKASRSRTRFSAESWSTKATALSDAVVVDEGVALRDAVGSGGGRGALHEAVVEDEGVVLSEAVVVDVEGAL